MSANQNLKQILDQLVNVPSVTGDLKAAKEVIETVSRIVKDTGALQTQGEINGYPYLTVSSRKPDDNTIWFVSHLDVVPADSSMFKVTSDAENYYGRGVFDMKGMAASTLAAFLSLPDLKKKNVSLMFTTDEETGGKNGVGALAGKGLPVGAAFVFDQSADWVLQEKMKGIIWLEVTAKGQAAHGARPWLGHNANQEIVNFLGEFKAWYDKTINQDAPENYYTTFNLGTVHGGEATNQVGDRAVATIDVRFVDEGEAAHMTGAARKLAKKFKGISVKELMHEPCVNNDTNAEWYKKTVKFMEELGIKPGPNGERFGHGSTDGRFFAPFNVPVITTRPPGGGQHGPGEWVGKKGLDELEKLCAKLMSATGKN